MIPITLRPYQLTADAKIRDAIRRKVRRLLLVMPCGSGKTVVFTNIARGAAAKKKSVAIVAHRKELISQASDKLNRFEVPHGIIKAGIDPNYLEPIQVASVQTLQNRTDKINPDTIIADEAHHSQSAMWQEIIKKYAEAILLGVTASPIFGNGKTLGGYYDELIEGPQVAELVEQGYLVRTRVFAPPPVARLEGVDYTDLNELEAAMNKRKVTGNAIEHYRKIAPGQPAIVFTVNVKHSHDVAEQFREAGFNFQAIDGTMDDDLRDKILKDFENGDIDGVCSCDLIGEGTDLPRCAVIIKLRPTKSFGLNKQHDGRPSRPLYAAGFDLETQAGRLAAIAASSKPCAYSIDCVNNLHFHGYPDDHIVWSLDKDPIVTRAGGTSVPVCQCELCYEVFPPAEKCPNCGHIRPIKERKLLHTKGELVEMKRAAAAAIVADKSRKKIEREEKKKETERQKIIKNRERKDAKTLPELIAFAKKYGYENPVGWANQWLEFRKKYRK